MSSMKRTQSFYELILAGAQIGDTFVVDISIGQHSIGQHWSKYWSDNDLATLYGERCFYPHPIRQPILNPNPIRKSPGVIRLRHSAGSGSGCKTLTLRAANSATT